MGQGLITNNIARSQGLITNNIAPEELRSIPIHAIGIARIATIGIATIHEGRRGKRFP